MIELAYLYVIGWSLWLDPRLIAHAPGRRGGPCSRLAGRGPRTLATL